MAFEIGEPILPGTQFGSRFPGIPNETVVADSLPDRLLRCVQKLSAAFLGAFTFDKWTYNRDGRPVIFHRPAEE